MPTQPARARSTTLTNLAVDAGLFASTLLALAPAFTGLPIHEWLSLALAAAFVLHLLLHWSWLAGVARRLLGSLPGSARFKALLNIALFIDFTLLTFTGVMISRAALPALGLSLAGSEAWMGLHRLTADASVFLMGVHLAIHWKWIVSTVRRYLTPGRRPAVALAPAVVPAEVE